jgi:hypothetical protein
MGEGLAMGPWDKKPQPSAGRLANHLEIHIDNLSTFALEGVQARNYRKNPEVARHRTYSLKRQPEFGKIRVFRNETESSPHRAALRIRPAGPCA